jgi:hypothetical protein
VWGQVRDLLASGMTWQESYLKAAETALVFDGTKLNREQVRHACRNDTAFSWENGAPGVTRTRDPLLRRQMLYPAELRAHWL